MCRVLHDNNPKRVRTGGLDETVRLVITDPSRGVIILNDIGLLTMELCLIIFAFSPHCTQYKYI